MDRLGAGRLDAAKAWWLVVAVLSFACLLIPERGLAAFPGSNGEIAFVENHQIGVEIEEGEEFPIRIRTIWAVGPDGGEETWLTPDAVATGPAYSPNGRRIAFEGQGRDLYAADADGSDPVLLYGADETETVQTSYESDWEDPESGLVFDHVKIETTTESWDYVGDPAFSPDGTRVAASRNTGSFLEEWVCAVPAAESSECIPSEEPGSFEGPGDSSGCIECREHIIALDATTGTPTADLTPATEQGDSEPAYSVDGKLAFVREDFENNEVMVVPSPGTEPMTVLSGASFRNPDFSPDGSTLVVAQRRNHLKLLPALGGAVVEVPVTAVPGADYEELDNPVFSPDGTRIAFHRFARAGFETVDDNLYTLKLDGSDGLAVAEGGDQPAWQPVPPEEPAIEGPVHPSSTAPATAVSGPWAERKRMTKPSRKGKAGVGRIVCGSSRCALKVLSTRLKIGGKRVKARVRAQKRLGAGKRARVKLTLRHQPFAMLKDRGRGRLVTRVRVTDSAGKRVLTLRTTLRPLGR
jgi:Tol biopolymer transport system component